jgi:hypothetical protein
MVRKWSTGPISLSYVTLTAPLPADPNRSLLVTFRLNLRRVSETRGRVSAARTCPGACASLCPCRHPRRVHSCGTNTSTTGPPPATPCSAPTQRDWAERLLCPAKTKLELKIRAFGQSLDRPSPCRRRRVSSHLTETVWHYWLHWEHWDAGLAVNQTPPSPPGWMFGCQRGAPRHSTSVPCASPSAVARQLHSLTHSLGLTWPVWLVDAAFSESLLSRHMDRYSTLLTQLWYTDRRRLHSPAGNAGLMIFCVFIISRKSEKLRTVHMNLPANTCTVPAS